VFTLFASMCDGSGGNTVARCMLMSRTLGARKPLAYRVRPYRPVPQSVRTSRTLQGHNALKLRPYRPVLRTSDRLRYFDLSHIPSNGWGLCKPDRRNMC
jgi:hypothetical protein